MSTPKLTATIFSTIFILIVGIFALWVYSNDPKTDSENDGQAVEINGVQKNSNYSVIVAPQGSIIVDIADTPELRTRGLSGRRALPTNQGLFFVFESSDYWGIWMKDMLFPIDVMWLDEQLRVVHIEKNISPNSYPKTFSSRSPARYILEINAGVSDDLKINIGSELEFQKSTSSDNEL